MCFKVCRYRCADTEVYMATSSALLARLTSLVAEFHRPQEKDMKSKSSPGTLASLLLAVLVFPAVSIVMAVAMALILTPAHARNAAKEAAREEAKEARIAARAEARESSAEDTGVQAAAVSAFPGRLLKVPTRQDAAIPVFWIPREGATATVILMPGGSGGFGHIVDGQPDGGNFLVRSRDYFVAQGFNVAVVSRASDLNDLDYGYRTSEEHVGDLKKVVAALKRESPVPVWMIGTSRGTVSTAAAAVAFGNEQLAGIVLTSSVVNQRKPGAVPSQPLDKIRIPVLVLHHESDACIHCRPGEVRNIIRGLDNCPIKKQIMVSGGGNPTGDVCAAHHYHGFIGMEKEAVDTIAGWIHHPTT